MMRLSRRQWMLTMGTPAAIPALAGAADRAKVNMIVRSIRPEDLEMPLDGFHSWITPVERFFVRSHMYTPAINAAQWRLRVHGLVKSAIELTLPEIRKLPRVELVSVLECAGNGRSFYHPTIIGMPWQYGAAGNGRWTGVRLGDVLRKAGLSAGAKEVAFNGADVAIGTMPDFVRSMPLDKALHADTLLAFDLNGEPLPASHGFPLRLVAPGWAGDSWTKWVTDIEVLDKEHEGFFMKTAYRRPVHPVAPGAALDPAAMTPVTTLRVKSVIASHVDGQKVPLAPSTIRGAAWSGGPPIVKVDVSTDSGRTWKPAALGKDQAKYGWRLWEARWTPTTPASYVVMARATDASGDTQPMVADWNPSGYLWNQVQKVRVEAGEGSAAASSAKAPPVPEFPAKAKAACLGCHGTDIIAGQHLSRAQWERETDKMVRWGAPVKAEDRAELLDFLVRHFGPQ